MKTICKIATLLLLMLSLTCSVQAKNEMDITSYRVYRIHTGATTKDDAFFMAHSTTNTTEKDGLEYCVYEVDAVPSNFTGTQQSLLYRQDGKKIYRYDETQQAEVLMFDFSLNVGDVFTTPQGRKMEVVEVGDCKDFWDYWWTLTYPGKALRLKDYDNASVEDMWVEGIGSLHTGILPYEMFTDAEGCSLDFCHMGAWGAVFPQNTPNYKSVESEPFAILDHEQPEHWDYAFSDDTLVISGCAELNCYSSIISCFVNDGIIDISEYVFLFYGMDVFNCRTLMGFEIKIPGFQPGEYTIMIDGQKRTSVVCPSTLTTIPTNLKETMGIDGSPYKCWHGAVVNDTGTVLKDNLYAGQEDVELDGKTYARVSVDFTDSNNTNETFTQLYREEGKKVYRYDETTMSDVLLFDYGLKTGDEVTVDGGVRLRVVDTGLPIGYEQNYYTASGKVLQLQGVDDVNIRDVWIQGIGSAKTGLLTANSLQGIKNVYLASVETLTGTFALFKVNGYSYNTATVTVEAPSPSEEEAFGNWMETYSTPYFQDLSYSFMDGYLHVSGAIMMCNYDAQAECRVEGEEIHLSITEMGLTITGPRLRHVDFKLAWFNPGTYTIYTNTPYSGQSTTQVVYYPIVEEYYPIVEEEKVWHFMNFNMGSNQPYEVEAFFTSQTESRDGKEYYVLYEKERSANAEAKAIDLMREENKQVFRYNESKGKEEKIYDFSVHKGATFTLGVDGAVAMQCTDEGEIVADGEKLRTITVCPVSDPSVQTTWVEGVGALRYPSENGLWLNPDSWSYNLTYVYKNDFSDYYPFAFNLPYFGWQGQNLEIKNPRSFEDMSEEEYNELVGHDAMQYEIIPGKDDTDVFHAWGHMWTSCAYHHYVYCIEERTSMFESNLRLDVEAVPVAAPCLEYSYVDLYFPFFSASSGRKYTVTDSEGTHEVPLKKQNSNYRPFIAEDKVWKVGWFPDGEYVAQRLANYYFDGDTLVGGQAAKRLMCEWQAAPDYAFEDGNLTYTEYVAALYETGRRVYFALPGQTEFKLLYDFGAEVGEKFVIGDGLGFEDTYTCMVIDKGRMDDYDYKGNYVDIYRYDEYDEYDHYDEGDTWLEGVGCTPTPMNNHEMDLPDCKCDYIALLSCVAGDELIYRCEDPTKIDGVTPLLEGGSEDAKRRIDFTHTIKTQPKSPRFSEAQSTEESVSGEYDHKWLEVELGLLQDTYDVTITSPSGNAVYQKEVQAGNVLALNIDISTLTDTDYTLTLENSNESFTGTFNPSILTDIESLTPDSIVNNKSANRPYYDLTGRPVSVPSQGMYIQDGKKVWVK